MKGELILHCMPLMEKAVGSAWGLPVIRDGKKRISALTASKKLEAVSNKLEVPPSGLAAEELRSLEAMGIGPLGRYLGGEPIKPIPLGPGHFFSFNEASPLAELFCGIEFDDTRWQANGDTAELFRSHLEFLRTWGFSGGVTITKAVMAELLGAYLAYLQKETENSGAKIIALLSKAFFETLQPFLQTAKPFGETGAAGIPVNFTAGGDPVLSSPFSGLGIILYEDLPPHVRTLKPRCDILVIAETGTASEASPVLREINGSLCLTISTPVKEKKEPPDRENKSPRTKKKNLSVHDYLFRHLIPEKPGAPVPALEFPAASVMPGRRKFLRPVQAHRRPFAGNGEEAAALGLLPQWEAGRVEAAGGGLFAVTAKFSGLQAADFKEEQAVFYRESLNIRRGTDPKPPYKEASRTRREAPPIGRNAAFTSLKDDQLSFFFYFRNECRRGNCPDLFSPEYAEAYITLYARELVVSMGREGPVQHFLALRDLFHAYGKIFPETGAMLCRWLLDFAAVYGIAAEALPFIIEELWAREDHAALREQESGPYGEVHSLLLDLALHRFFIEEGRPLTTIWPCIKALIPQKILYRKAHEENWAAHCCTSLDAIDKQLRRDWNRGIFEIFYPSAARSSSLDAFGGLRALGESSYTVYRPGFSSHRPLIDLLSALALDPASNPLPGVQARLAPLSLESELLEELRKESDAVREILKTDGTLPFEVQPSGRLPVPGPALPGPAYMPPDRSAMAEFVSALDETLREALRNMVTDTTVSETSIDAINGAFLERFGDLLIGTGPGGPSISAEYEAILKSLWQ
jgi:hypothetical protein